MVAATIWGAELRGVTVCFHCDNSVVVEVLNRHSTRDSSLCYQLRAQSEFNVVACHMPGV